MKTDQEIAEEYRKKLSSALAVVNGIVDMAKEHGMLISYSTGDDPISGRQRITNITISKKL